MSHDRDEGGARALPPRSAQIAQKWCTPLSGPSIVVQSRRPFPACSRARPRRPCGIVSPARPWRPAAPASSRKKGGGREPLEGGSVPVNEIGADSDESRGVGPAAPPTGCRASRRGAPGPQGALRPLGFCSGTAVRRFCLALAARPGNAPSGSPSPLALLAPPVSRERLHSIACSWPRSFRRVARLGLSLRASKRSLRVAFGSPPLTIPMGWQDMHCGVQTVVPTVCPSQ